MAVSDAELVARVQRGDVEAFGPLAERYEKTLLAAAVVQLRDIHTAEDVVQAAMLRAFQRLGTLRDGSKFGPWLMQIAHFSFRARETAGGSTCTTAPLR